MYETGIMDYEQKRIFLKWFKERIGVDYDVYDDPGGEIGKYYIVFVDLEGDEVDLIAEKEIELGIEPC